MFQPENRGTVNGYGQATAALGRFMGPIVSSPLFAWSENSGNPGCLSSGHWYPPKNNNLVENTIIGKNWPLNYHLVYDLLVLGSIGAAALSFLLPASVEKKREHESTVTTAAVQVVETVSEQQQSSSSDKDGNS